MDQDTDSVLENYGGAHINNLLNTLGNDADDETDTATITYSPYVATDTLIQSMSKHKNKFTVLSINAQSINAKFDALNILLDRLHEGNFSFSAICIQETWLEEHDDLSTFQLNGYKLINLGRICSKHGGLFIYLRNDFNYSIYDVYVRSNLWEGLFIEITDGGLKQNLILGNIYRPPRHNNNNATINEFINEFKPVINSLARKNSNVILTGDFNINLLQVNEREAYQDYLDNLMSQGFYPKITFPTRFSTKTCSLLDQIFCKLSHDTIDTYSAIIHTQISDHLPCFSCLDIITPNNIQPKFVKINTYSPAAIKCFSDNIKTSIQTTTFDLTLNADPNPNYNKLENIITHAKQLHLPSKTVKFKKYKHRKNPWVTFGIIRSIKLRDKTYRKMLTLNPNSIEYNDIKCQLKEYNKLLNKCLRLSKAQYYESLFLKFKNDAKKTWSTINSILSKTKQPKVLPDYLIVENIKLDNTREIAEKFNDFFINIGPTLSKNIKRNSNKHFSVFLKDKTQHIFTFTPVNITDVSKSIKELKGKSSSGHDNISTRLLKDISPVIVSILTHIIKQSLNTGIFPQRLKIAKVVPLFKKGDPYVIDNYRPISLLPSLSKVFEKIVFKELYDYFLKKKLLYNSQYGFRTDHSTEQASLEFVDKISMDMDNGKIPIAFFLDLSKAFDTLDHAILLTKLQHYGICESALNWFRSYLTNRSQFVDFDGTHSSCKEITTGVPQGSILGPLLFIIYMNDIQFASNILHSVLYADDTSLTTPLCAFRIPLLPSHNKELSRMINLELDKIHEWLTLNKLSLNVSKTKFMLFHHKKRNISKIIPTVEIDSIRIERVTVFNFLGLTVDENLTWDAHVNKISNKISRSIGILNRLKRFLPKSVLKTIYNSTILPHLQYCILCWGKNISRLRKLQKKAIRIISISKYNAHTEPLFKCLNLLKLDDIFTYFSLKFYYKYCSQTLPAYFLNMFKRNTDIHTHDTRQLQSLHPAKRRTAAAGNCIRFYLPETIKSTPEIILSKIRTHSYAGFSQYIKRHMVNKYDAVCHIVNCYICQSHN